MLGVDIDGDIVNVVEVKETGGEGVLWLRNSETAAGYEVGHTGYGDTA